MGKIDIDYQVLHDAFFKFQTKPKMTAVGEVYYEGKEYETPVEGSGRDGSRRRRERRWASRRTGPALADQQQRYGPRPRTRTSRSRASPRPSPRARSSGTTPGVGQAARRRAGPPIYGDVFGVGGERPDESTPYDLVLRKDEPWGALEDVDESEDESEGESDEEGSLAEGSEPDAAEEAAGAEPEALEPLDLRKEKRGKGEEDEGPPQLYRVLDVEDASVAEEPDGQRAHVRGARRGRRGGRGARAAPGARGAAGGGRDGDRADPEDLERGMDDAAVAARFEAETAARRAAAAPETSRTWSPRTRKSKRKADKKKRATRKVQV